LRSGETASVMLVAPTSGRWALVTTSADGILETRVVRMEGTVKLVQFPVDSRHVPNFFVTASTIFDRQFATETERIVVPPVEQFLTVDVKTDREQYEPRHEGTVTVTTRDAAGRPVPAEVALSVSDEAVTAIQTDPAGDPRQFFYSDIRHANLQVSAVHAQRYVSAEDQKKEQPVAEEQRRLRREYDDLRSAKMGGVVGNAVAEAVTVTAAAPVPAPPPPAAPVAQRADAPPSHRWKFRCGPTSAPPHCGSRTWSRMRAAWRQ
jgi:hypothetical protein